MKLPFELSVGLRYMKAKRKQAFVSVITSFSVVGVMLGVMTLIIVLGVMNGFEKDLKEKILGTVSHLVVMSQSSRQMSDWRGVMKRIEPMDGISAFTPYVYGQAMVSNFGRVRGIIVRGIDLATSGKVIALPQYLRPKGKVEIGDIRPGKDGLPGIFVGEELAAASLLKIGDVVQLISPQGKRTPIGAVPRVQKFRVAGLFKSGMYEFDANLVYMELNQAQNFFEMGNGVTGIELALSDIYDAPKLAGRIEAMLGPHYSTRTWMAMYSNLFSAMKLEKIAMFIILMFIVLVAAFNIVISLIMLVMEKNRDIAILKALGATSDRIMRIFVAQGMIVGIVGTALGALGGIGGAALLTRYPIIELPPEIYTISKLPVAVEPMDVVITCAAALTICFLATIYPSLRAARLEPVEALRYE
mgnify:CR=1 FL=1